MRKIGVVALATLSLFVLGGAPAAHATDLPDVPISVRAPSAATASAGAGYSAECTRKSSIRPVENEPISSEFCVYHEVNKVWGTLDMVAPRYPSQKVVFDLYVYRCRLSDDVCVVISSTYGVAYTSSSTGTWSVATEKTTQTWDRYYKTCASLDLQGPRTYWEYGFQCTSILIP